MHRNASYFVMYYKTLLSRNVVTGGKIEGEYVTVEIVEKEIINLTTVQIFRNTFLLN